VVRAQRFLSSGTDFTFNLISAITAVHWRSEKLDIGAAELIMCVEGSPSHQRKSLERVLCFLSRKVFYLLCKNITFWCIFALFWVS